MRSNTYRVDHLIHDESKNEAIISCLLENGDVKVSVGINAYELTFENKLSDEILELIEVRLVDKQYPTKECFQAFKEQTL